MKYNYVRYVRLLKTAKYGSRKCMSNVRDAIKSFPAEELQILPKLRKGNK